MLMILRNFVLAWLGVFAVLIVISCVMYKDAIVNTVSGNLWALFNGLMPLALMAGAIIYLIRLAFK